MERAKKTSAGFWSRAKKLLKRSVRARKGVNLSRLSKLTKEGETVLVADKVLGSGELKHKITLAAPGFSQSAKEALEKSGAKITQISQLKKSNPKGEGIKLII